MPPMSLIRFIGFWRYALTLWHIVSVKFHHLFWRTETISAEISWGMIAMSWAIVFLLADPFEIGNLYQYLSRWGTEEDWTVVMVMLGMLQLGLGLLAKMEQMRLFRSIVWFLSFVLWSYIAWVSVLAVPTTTAAGAYSVLAIGSAWAFVRSREGGC